MEEWRRFEEMPWMDARTGKLLRWSINFAVE
jgi:hypothetical protein